MVGFAALPARTRFGRRIGTTAEPHAPVENRSIGGHRTEPTDATKE